jgi:putative component of toxin-antitoxin plasmid stabilization module
MSDLLEVVPTVWYTNEVRALPRKERDRIDRKLISLALKGWNAAMADLSVKHLRDGIYEVRVLGRGSAFRILFFLAPGRSPRLVVLTTCASKSVMQKKQRLDAEVERAAGRRAMWLEQQRKGGE